MNGIFHDFIDDFMVVYIEDMLVFSKDAKSHLRHLETVLPRLKEHEMYVSSMTFPFFMNEMHVLGLIIWKNFMKVNP